MHDEISRLITIKELIMDPHSIFNATVRDGGATLDSATLNPLTGYQITAARYAVGGARGIPERSFDLDNPGTPNGVEQYVRELALRPTVHTVGTWIDQENHKIVVDAVSRFATRDFALLKARDRGEQAIFDLATATEITVS